MRTFIPLVEAASSAGGSGVTPSARMTQAVSASVATAQIFMFDMIVIHAESAGARPITHESRSPM